MLGSNAFPLFLFFFSSIKSKLEGFKKFVWKRESLHKKPGLSSTIKFPYFLSKLIATLQLFSTRYLPTKRIIRF